MCLGFQVGVSLCSVCCSHLKGDVVTMKVGTLLKLTFCLCQACVAQLQSQHSEAGAGTLSEFRASDTYRTAKTT